YATLYTMSTGKSANSRNYFFSQFLLCELANRLIDNLSGAERATPLILFSQMATQLCDCFCSFFTDGRLNRIPAGSFPGILRKSSADIWHESHVFPVPELVAIMAK